MLKLRKNKLREYVLGAIILEKNGKHEYYILKVMLEEYNFIKRIAE